MINAEYIARHLGGARKTGGGWMAKCPAHDDSTPSLSINDAANGKPLVHCQAGCSQDAVIAELRRAQLWHARNINRSSEKPKVADKYDYQDENGQLLYQVVRMKPKSFRQRRPDGAGGWTWSVKDVRRVPYRLVDIIARPDEPVHIVEGEKDADALHFYGLLATCNAGGAGKWPPEASDYLQGRRLLIIPDNDDAGSKHAVDVAKKLSGVAQSVFVVDLAKHDPGLPEKGDVSDWLEHGGDPTLLESLAVPFDEWFRGLTLIDAEIVSGKEELPTATPFYLGDPTKIPPRKFIYDRHFIRSFVSVIGGVGGSGKSTIVTTEALAIATGQPLLGIDVIEPCNVWYVNLEDPMEEIERRLTATAKHFRVTREQLDDRLFLSSGRSSDFVIVRDSSTGVEVVELVKEAIKDQIRANNIGVLIIDPFVKCHRVSENANEKIDAVVTELAEIAEETKVAIMLVSHLRKGAGQHGKKTVKSEADDIRGASSLVGAVRSARIVQTMSEFQSKNAGVDNRFLFSQVWDAKANMAPRANEAIWRELTPVNLGNATDEQPSDWVAIAEQWVWPDDDCDTFIAGNQSIAQKIAMNGNYRADPQAKDWIGYNIAKECGLDLKEGPQLNMLKRALKEWINSGALKEVVKPDKNRTQRKFIEVGESAANSGGQ